jgi:hypothetical protein
VALGLEPEDGRLTIDPLVPEKLGQVRLEGIHATGKQWDVQAEGNTGSVEEGRAR